FSFQAEDGIRDGHVTGVQTCALPISVLARNPVPVIVPCHRVVREDGSWGHYAFGHAMKTLLLTLERATPVLVGSTTTRIVCRRGCPHEQRVADSNRVVFASVPDARSVGYR